MTTTTAKNGTKTSGSTKTHRFANGDAIPLVGLGTWKSDPGEVYAAVREAIRIGYRHIDCAVLYGNQVEIGQALRDAIRDGDVTRKELWITSKLWSNAHGRKNVAPALQKTLADLGLEYLDLYLIHWPIALQPTAVMPGTAADFLPLSEAPIHEAWAAMEATVDAGLVHHLGVSNFSAKKISELLPYCKLKPEVNQVELHPLLQQNELVAYCTSQGIHVTAYAPLGSGDRPAIVKAPDAPVLLDNPVIGSIAQAHERTAAQVLIAWHIQRGISAVPKSVSPARLRENFEAAELEVTQAELERIAALDQGYRMIARSGLAWLVVHLDEALCKRATRACPSPKLVRAEAGELGDVRRAVERIRQGLGRRGGEPRGPVAKDHPHIRQGREQRRFRASEKGG